MNNQYSDEHINAYIDGELDNDERVRLLFDEQQDKTLANRINDARMLKEKVQLAYSRIPEIDNNKETFSFSDFISNKKPLVAGFLLLIISTAFLLPEILKDNHEIVLAKQLIKNTTPISSETLSDAIGTNTRVLINLSQYRPETFDSTINNIRELLHQHRNDRSFNIELVAHKSGLKALDTKTSSHAEKITLLAKEYGSFDIVACAKSMADLASSGNPVQLMQSIMTTPSAAKQIAKRTREGWMYLKI